MTDKYRQGDLLFVKAENMPKGIFRSKDSVILRGEATGHSHKLVNGVVFKSFLFMRRTEEIWVKVGEDGRVIHEEHKTLELPTGVYQVIRQREFNPYRPMTVND